MNINLRGGIAWLRFRMNRKRRVGQKMFGYFAMNVRTQTGEMVFKDFVAGPLVIQLQHWRSVDD